MNIVEIGALSFVGIIFLFLIYLSTVSLVAFLYNRSPKRFFGIALFFAKRGWYKHPVGIETARVLRIPTGYVTYKDGSIRGEYPLGNAVFYQKVIGGNILPYEKKK